MKARVLEMFRQLHVYHPRCLEIMGGGGTKYAAVKPGECCSPRILAK